MTRGRWTVIGAPIDCVGAAEAASTPFGTELAPGALRARGLPHALGAVDAGDLAVRLVGDARDPATGLVGWPSLGEVTSTMRSRVGSVVRDAGRPLVLGGCCTALMGALAGARDALGRVGLAYVDGHLDLYDERTSPTGEAADMPVAALLGHGGSPLLELLDAPVLGVGDLALLGPRDLAEAAALGSLLPDDLGLPFWDAAAVRSDPDAAARGARERLAGVDATWLHLDVDVLDQDAFPATDYLMPGGLDLADLAALLTPLGRDPRLIGFSLGCYNPAKDPDGRYGDALVSLLTEVLA